MSVKFVHLHVHTEYSLVDSVVRIKPLMQVVANSMPAVALTDIGNMFAMVKFYQAAIAAGIKPIIGTEVWVVGENIASIPDRLVLLCQSNQGYRNLCELISKSYQDGQINDRPTLQKSWLTGKTDGLIALSGGRVGDIGRAILANNNQSALQYLADWMSLFPDRFYLEVHRTGREGEELCLQWSLEFSRIMNCPIVATNDVRFINASDFEAHEAKVCIHEGRTLSDPRRTTLYSKQQYLRSAEEMADLFKDIPEAIQNTVEIAKRCNLHLTLGESVLPDFPVPEGMTESHFFIRQSKSGLAQRLAQRYDSSASHFDEIKEKYQLRLQEELEVIIQMGFSGYFLIVADFIEWARKNAIPVGPGRGSGAGSLVAYALKITDIDPLAYDLLFERFLNPERVSLPDFDVDFCMEGRDQVINYVSRMYGADRVSQIITYGSMAAKAVVRDVGRVLGHPYGFVDSIARQIPFEIGMTLNKALAESPDLKTSYDSDDEVRHLLDLALSLEGLARNAGKHAGGVVIAPSKLTDFSPLYCEADGSNLITQYDKDDIESVGLVKFDFLGLRTLTIIDKAVQAINAQHGNEQKLDIASIPLDDKTTFELLQRCETTAIFQLESRGMKDLIKRLRPDCFEDIIALVALFRPGPLQSGMVDDFIVRKKNDRAGKVDQIDYLHPLLEGILKPTYGVILYQEQVMQIAQVLSGYTLGSADMLRRAMGKKKADVMEQMRASFISGAQKNGVDSLESGHIFDLIEKFAGYGFNKSHSAAYALLSYQTAWLKAHHSASFMCAVLSSDMDNTDKIVNLKRECDNMGLSILSPDVNTSNIAFVAVDNHTIRYGLGAIKSVGEAALTSIIQERRHSGPFVDLDDFCRRVDLGKVNKRVIESLVRSGGLDNLGPNRATLMKRLPDAVRGADQYHRDQAAGQSDLFGTTPTAKLAASSSRVNDVIPEWSNDEFTAAERDSLGLYLTRHPIDQYLDELSRFTHGRILAQCEKIEPTAQHRKRGDNDAIVAGLVVDFRSKNMSDGGKMAFVTIDDNSARVDVIVGSDLFDSVSLLLQKDVVLVVSGELGYDDFSGGYRLRAKVVMDIDGARRRYAQKLIVQMHQNVFAKGFMDQFYDTLAAYRDGQCQVIIHYATPQTTVPITLGEGWRVKPTGELLKKLGHLHDKCEAQYLY